MSVINRGFFDEAVQAAGEEINYLADINEDTVEESQYEIGLEGTMMHLYEAEEAWNKIQTYVAIEEFMGFKETGDTEYVLEEEKSEGFFTSVINWFKSMAGKVVATFKKFFAYMASKIKSDKAFIKKFKNTNIVVPEGLYVKGYEFSTDFNVQNVVGQCDTIINKVLIRTVRKASQQVPEAKAELDHFKSDYKAIVARMRGYAIHGRDVQLGSKEYSKELFKFFRTQQEKPTSIHIVKDSLPMYIKIVEDHATNVKAAKTSMDKIKEAINKTINQIKTDKKELDDNLEKSAKSVAFSYADAKIKLYKEKISILVQMNGALISALNQQNRQAKAIVYTVNGKQSKAVKENAIQTTLGNF